MLYSPYYGIWTPLLNDDCHKYDAICYIDCDVLATSHARDITKHISKDSISAHFVMGKIWANSGVVSFPRSLYSKFTTYLSNLRALHKMPRKYPGNRDQKILNYFMIPDRYHDLAPEFNWLMFRYDINNRLDKSLIHYMIGFKKMMKSDFPDPKILK